MNLHYYFAIGCFLVGMLHFGNYQMLALYLIAGLLAGIRGDLLNYSREKK